MKIVWNIHTSQPLFLTPFLHPGCRRILYRLMMFQFVVTFTFNICLFWSCLIKESARYILFLKWPLLRALTALFARLLARFPNTTQKRLGEGGQVGHLTLSYNFERWSCYYPCYKQKGLCKEHCKESQRGIL